MKVLVTGATGFVGRAVVDRLLAEGHQVRAALRHADARVPTGVEGVHVGGIDGSTTWRAALAGVEGVVHLAARVHAVDDHAMDSLESSRRINRDGTRCLARACEHVERFVMMSSIKAVVDESYPRPIDETTTAAPTSPYGISKLEGEREVAEAARAIGYSWIVLRPPLVFGEGVRGNLRRLMDAVWYRIPLPLGAVHNRRSLIYVRNLADAVEHALKPNTPSGIAFPLTDGPPFSTSSLVREFADAMGRSAPLLPVPPPWLETGARLLGRDNAWRRIAGNLEISEDVRERLRWTPPVTPAPALRQTGVAYLNERRSSV